MAPNWLPNVLKRFFPGHPGTLFSWRSLPELSWKTALPLLLPLLGFGIYSLHSFIRYNAMLRFTHAGGLSMEKSRLFDRLEGNLLQIGGATVFPIMMAYAFAVRGRRYHILAVIGAVAVSLGVFYYWAGTYPLSSVVLFSMFFTAGAMMLITVISRAIEALTGIAHGRTADRDYLFLGIWLLATIAMVTFLLPHATAKYSLPFLAPLVLLMIRELEDGGLSRQAFRAITLAMVLLTLLAGLAVAAADYRLAMANRDFARGISVRYGTGGDVWFESTREF